MSKQSSHKQKPGKKHSSNPGPSVQQYNGPIISKSMKEEEELYVVPLRFTGVVSSSAGAVIDSFYSSDPNSYALGEWASLNALYGEYRVLGMVVKFFPNNRYSKTTVNCTPLMVYTDRELPTAATGSYQTAMSHESCRILSLEDPWSHEVKMSNAEESQFISTTGTQALYSVKFYADSLSVSTTYGRMFVDLRIQFRARR